MNSVYIFFKQIEQKNQTVSDNVKHDKSCQSFQQIMLIIAQQSNMINKLILTNNKPHLKHNLETTGKSGRLENKCAKKTFNNIQASV
jgi:hypothetical protein